MTTEFSFPLLQESLALDFANTLYGNGEEYFNLFTSALAIQAWCEQSGLSTDLQHWDDDDFRAFIALRNSAHEVFHGLAADEQIRDELLEIIEDSANLAARIRCVSSRDGAIVDWYEFQAPEGPAMIARLANSVIDLATGPDARRITQCEAPDCTLFFVQTHGSRRYCQSNCADRTRQAAYRHRAND